MEQTEKKLLFCGDNSSNIKVYGEFDKSYFDEYTVDSFNKLIVNGSKFSTSYDTRAERYEFCFPFEEWLKQGHYGIQIKNFVTNELKGYSVINADVFDGHIEKPFFFKDQIPILKETNTPLPTCFVLSKKSKSLKYFQKCEIRVSVNDCVTIGDGLGESIITPDVMIKNNPQPFANLYSGYFLKMIMKLPAHLTIYGAPSSPLLCINNFPDYRIAIIFPVINEE